MAVTKEVFSAAEAIRELANGYAFQLPNQKGLLMTTAEFIQNEKLCCPFFSFGVHVESGGGPIWLQMTGPDGVKPFIQAEIGGALPEAVAKAADFHAART
ncbi:MAG: hypothetical protein AB1451_12290 [Nitrospirota bacterium]